MELEEKNNERRKPRTLRVCYRCSRQKSDRSGEVSQEAEWPTMQNTAWGQVRWGLESPVGCDNKVVILDLLKSSFIFNLLRFCWFILFCVILYFYNLMLLRVCDNQSNLSPDFPVFLLNAVLFQNCVLECESPTICQINVL